MDSLKSLQILHRQGKYDIVGAIIEKLFRENGTYKIVEELLKN